MVGETRFLRKNGNLRVRRQRRRRGIFRWFLPLSILPIVIGGGSLFMVHARSYLVESDLFRIRRVTFQEHRSSPPEKLQEFARIVLSRNIFEVDLATFQERLVDYRWIRRARVRRILPDTLHITLQERNPVAIIPFDGRLHLIDPEGVMIELFETKGAGGGYPVLDGLPARVGKARRLATARGLRLVMELGSRYPELLKQVARIDLEYPKAIDLYFVEGATPLRLPSQGSLGTLPAYLRIRDRIAQRVPSPDRIDLRWEEQISVTSLNWRKLPG